MIHIQRVSLLFAASSHFRTLRSLFIRVWGSALDMHNRKKLCMSESALIQSPSTVFPNRGSTTY